MNSRPKIPKDKIIKVSNNTKKIDFKKPYTFIYFDLWFNIITIIPFTLIVLLAFLSTFFFSLKIDGKKNLKILKQKGCILISNHCHYFDTVFIGLKLLPVKVYISVAQRNYEIPYIRRILRIVRAFPIPALKGGLEMITDPIGEALKRKHSVLFLPEGDLVHLSQTIHQLKRGAFYQSYIHQVPIVPLVYVLQRRKILGRELGANWITMTLVAGAAIYPPKIRDDGQYPKIELEQMQELAAAWMEDTIALYSNKNSGKK